jgi:hypothetical protein
VGFDGTLGSYSNPSTESRSVAAQAGIFGGSEAANIGGVD